MSEDKIVYRYVTKNNYLSLHSSAHPYFIRDITYRNIINEFSVAWWLCAKPLILESLQKQVDSPVPVHKMVICNTSPGYSCTNDTLQISHTHFLKPVHYHICHTSMSSFIRLAQHTQFTSQINISCRFHLCTPPRAFNRLHLQLRRFRMAFLTPSEKVLYNMRVKPLCHTIPTGYSA